MPLFISRHHYNLLILPHYIKRGPFIWAVESVYTFTLILKGRGSYVNQKDAGSNPQIITSP